MDISNKRMVDLTLPCEEHWRYAYKMERTMSHEEGGPWQESKFNMGTHWFTHIDWPRHHVAWGGDSEEYPIKDWAISRCLVLDLTNVPDNGAITADILAEANRPFEDEHYDMLFLRTDRGKYVDWKSKDFWDTAQYVTPDGAEWIKEYAPKVVGFDFPQDYDLRKMRYTKDMHEIKEPVHDIVLAAGGILMIEYLNYLWEIGTPVCDIIALPLRLPHIDGAQIRVIALVDKE